MANTYTRGTTIRLHTNPPFKNFAGVPTDPGTVTVRVTSVADAVTTDYTLAAAQVVKDTSEWLNGDFYYDLVTAGLSNAKLGQWVYAWIGTGAAAAADKNTFLLVSEITP
jgi:hypothetical protein